ncbi:MAG: thioredoxin [Phycisphaerales bacterium]|nr:MAG: thioredoxin [Phycisphaerales bacterium]
MLKHSQFTLAATILAGLMLVLATGCATTETVTSAEPIDDPFKDAIRSGSLSEAQARAETDDRLLIVVGTADWCGPCRRMKADTWTDRRVYDWTNRHALVYYLDIDEHRDIARSLEISSIPQIVVFRGDREIERVVGYRAPDPFYEWLSEL